LELKKKYPFRVIIDESYSIGVLGETGRGVTEHFDIPISDLELIVGSLSNAFGCVGGFALGTNVICNHMRLNCTGYVFSASLPPYISVACCTAIDIVKDGEELLKLCKIIEYTHDKFKGLNFFTTTSSSLSPLIHLRLRNSTGNKKNDQKILSEVVNQAFHQYNMILAHTRYLEREKNSPNPSIKIYLSSKHTYQEIDEITNCLNELVKD